MSHIEEALLRRFSGLKIVVWSIALGAACVLPLQLYILFGPADGNPIGLGLLAVAAVPIAGLGVVIGVIKCLVEYFARKEEAMNGCLSSRRTPEPKKNTKTK